MVAHMSDDQIWEMTRGGHDPKKVYAAYKAATEHKGQPTVILAKTVKGYGMGESGEGQMISHQAKKMNEEALRQFRDRFANPGFGRAEDFFFFFFLSGIANLSRNCRSASSFIFLAWCEIILALAGFTHPVALTVARIGTDLCSVAAL